MLGGLLDQRRHEAVRASARLHERAVAHCLARAPSAKSHDRRRSASRASRPSRFGGGASFGTTAAPSSAHGRFTAASSDAWTRGSRRLPSSGPERRFPCSGASASSTLHRDSGLPRRRWSSHHPAVPQPTSADAQRSVFRCRTCRASAASSFGITGTCPSTPTPTAGCWRAAGTSTELFWCGYGNEGPDDSLPGASPPSEERSLYHWAWKNIIGSHDPGSQRFSTARTCRIFWRELLYGRHGFHKRN